VKQPTTGFYAVISDGNTTTVVHVILYMQDGIVTARRQHHTSALIGIQPIPWTHVFAIGDDPHELDRIAIGFDRIRLQDEIHADERHQTAIDATEPTAHTPPVAAP